MPAWVRGLSTRATLAILACGAVLLALAGGLVLTSTSGVAKTKSKASQTGEGTPAGRISLAILGDSDSHSYHDRILIHPEQGQRGGALNASTWQWNELLAMLRGQQLDSGDWGRWGTWGPVASVQDRLGLGGRAPRKEDYQYNFAQSGAGCDNLMRWKTAPRLVRLMDEEPARWAHGVVVIRIGVNDFGTEEPLNALARNPMAPQVQAQIDACIAAIGQTVQLIQAHHPQTKVVLVGIFDSSHWAPLVKNWQSPQALKNIATGLDRFNQALRDMVARDASRLAYFDDQAWFAKLWGGRDAQGKPAYKVVRLGDYSVPNDSGDERQHATLADGHAGLVWNLLWTQAMIDLLNTSFKFNIPRLDEAEMVKFLNEHPAR